MGTRHLMLYFEIAVVAALIFLNGLLAMAELAVVSSRRSRLQALVDRDVIGSRRALALAANPGKFLSTVQIGITLVGVLSGAFSGATLGLRLTTWLASLGLPLGIAEPAGVGLVVAGITYASLIIGELVPKQIALREPERIAVRVAPAMTILAKIAFPLVFALDVSGRLLLRVLGYKPQIEHRVSEEEVRTLIAEAESAGVLEPGEREMIAGVMRLGDRPVGTVMTPRREVDAISIYDNVADIREIFRKSKHSRLPVYEDNHAHPIGVLQATDLLDASLSGQPVDIRALVREAPAIPESADARDVVTFLKNSSVHMGLVYDEYGDFLGVVTTADILESIVGTFTTDEGPPEEALVQRDESSCLISGWMPADEFADRLMLPLSEKRPYNTAAGFVLQHLGALPDVGQTFDAHGWRFEVIDMDGRRIDKILASRMN